VDEAGDEEVNLVMFNRADAKPGNVPESLSKIEAQAEDIIDIMPGDDWGQVNADIAAINAAWQAFQPQGATDNVPQAFQEALAAALDQLQRTSASKDAAGTRKATNDVSAAIVDLFAVYQPATPADLGRLDVLERQVVMDGEADNFTAAADSLATTCAVWARLKPVIMARNGSDAAIQFEESLKAQQAALDKQDASALATEAKDGLELMDSLEGLF